MSETFDPKQALALCDAATKEPWTHDAQLRRTCVTAGSLHVAECDVDAVPVGEMVANAAMIAYARTALSLAARRVIELEAERDAALREADRLRHGVAVEGDHVCPAELERDSARAEVERLTKERDELREMKGVNAWASETRAKVEVAKLRAFLGEALRGWRGQCDMLEPERICDIAREAGIE